MTLAPTKRLCGCGAELLLTQKRYCSRACMATAYSMAKRGKRPTQMQAGYDAWVERLRTRGARRLERAWSGAR